MSYQLVKEAVPMADYKVRVLFRNGARGLYDCKPLLENAFWSSLRNVKFFNQAHAECGTIVWNDEIDISPESVWEDCEFEKTS